MRRSLVIGAVASGRSFPLSPNGFVYRHNSLRVCHTVCVCVYVCACQRVCLCVPALSRLSHSYNVMDYLALILLLTICYCYLID